MDLQEAGEIIDFAQRTWPKWKPDRAELESWGRVLATVVSPDLARQALIQVKDTKDFNGPSRSCFLEALSQSRARGSENRQEPLHDGYCYWWVQATDGPNVGMFQTYGYPETVPLPDDYVLAKQYEKLRKDCERIYGGQWQVIRGDGHERMTYGAMFRRMEELRETAGWKPPSRGLPRKAVGGLVASALAAISDPPAEAEGPPSEDEVPF